ncbi:MAG TPA: hypothetical protein VID27_12515 [Blastocatellia bacterium]|jgi:hypothetical protein
MRRRTELRESDDRALQELHRQSIQQMLDDPSLTEDEKQELLRQIDLKDEDWEPVELPEGAEPLSKTIIEMRQGVRT